MSVRMRIEVRNQVIRMQTAVVTEKGMVYYCTGGDDAFDLYNFQPWSNKSLPSPVG